MTRPVAGMLLAATGSVRRRLVSALQHEWERGGTFLFVPVLLGAGAATYLSLAAEPAFLPLVLASLLLMAAAWLARHNLLLCIAVSAVLCFTVGILAAKFETWRSDTIMLGSEITTRVTGTIVRVERRPEGRARLTIDVHQTERPELRYQPDRIRATARSVGTDVQPGDMISALVRLRPAPGPIRPGGYDFARENYFDGIGANGFLMSAIEQIEKPPHLQPGQRLSIALSKARDRLALHISQSIGGEEGAVAAALITGARAGIPEDVNEALRRTGLAHILSISGLHMALVAGFVILLVRSGFALFPAFSSRWPVRKFAAGAALLAAFFYLFISGAGVATQRSFIMLAVMLAAVQFDRAAITMRNLAIAAIFVILMTPHEVAGPSFQMSFAATAALIAAYAAWSDRRERVAQAGVTASAVGLRRAIGFFARFFGGLAFTALIAGAATAIFAVYHFHRLAPLGMLANLAAMPVVSVAIMPFAVIATMLMPLGMEGPFLAVMGNGIAVVIAVARWLAERTAFDEAGILPAGAVIALSLGLVMITLLTSRLRLLAIPLFCIGLVLAGSRRLPDILIAEDGRLVGLRSESGELAVNRNRPNKFTANGWQRAVSAKSVVKPSASPASSPRQFECTDDMCKALHDSGAVIVHTGNWELARAACSASALIVVDDATAPATCPAGGGVVVTKRHLARRGSAVVFLDREGQGVEATIEFAIDEPYRPWHRQRAFSRASRGLEPWRRRKQ